MTKEERQQKFLQENPHWSLYSPSLQKLKAKMKRRKEAEYDLLCDIIELRCGQELPWKAVSKRLGISINKTKAIYHRYHVQPLPQN